MQNQSKWIFCLMAVLLCFSVCLAQEEYGDVTIQTVSVQDDRENFVNYPLLVDPQNRDQIEEINRAVFEEAEISAYLRVFRALNEGSTGLQVDFEANQGGHYVSIVISACGKMPKGRPSQKYYAFTFDLATGEKVAFEDLFDNPQLVLNGLEEKTADSVSAYYSDYMDCSGLLPLPTESFFLSDNTLTFYYENSTLSFLSGDSGALSFLYAEIPEDGAFANQESALYQLQTSAKKRIAQGTGSQSEEISHYIQAGLLPGLGLQNTLIGVDAQTLLSRLRQTIDCSAYPNGWLAEVEAPLFRENLLILDEAQEKVTGLLCKRMDLCGIITGQTTRNEWQSILGRPQMSLSMNEEQAQKQALVPGISDYYPFSNGYTLILHGNEEGILQAIILK